MQLLGELLLDRSNVKVMVKFVSELEYLKTIMDLLRDQSRSIQFEAFHVFKVNQLAAVRADLRRTGASADAISWSLAPLAMLGSARLGFVCAHLVVFN